MVAQYRQQTSRLAQSDSRIGGGLEQFCALAQVVAQGLVVGARRHALEQFVHRRGREQLCDSAAQRGVVPFQVARRAAHGIIEYPLRIGRRRRIVQAGAQAGETGILLGQPCGPLAYFPKDIGSACLWQQSPGFA